MNHLMTVRSTALAVVAAICTGVTLTGCVTDDVSTSRAWVAAPAAYKAAIAAAIDAHGCPEVSKDLVAAQFQYESGFRADMTSPAGAIGPAQILPNTLERYRARTGATDPANPADAAAIVVAVDCDHAAQLRGRSIAVTDETISKVWMGGMNVVGHAFPEVDRYAREIAHAAAPE